MDFEVLINDLFVNLGVGAALSPVTNKSVLSLANDFEDTKWREEKFVNFVWDNIALTALSVQEREKLAEQDFTKRAPLKTHDFRADDASNRDQVLRCLFFRQDRRVLGVFHPFFPRSSRIRRFQACLAL